MESTDNKSLVIVGGGITGLSAALIAAKAGLKVSVIEASDKFGGLLNTFEIGGSRLEHYYHHFFTHDAELNWLIKELSLEQHLIFKKTTMGVFRNGKIYDFNTPWDLFKFSPISFLDKIRFLLSSVFLGTFGNWKKYEDISAIKWLSKWSGKSTTASLWAPLINVKFGSYASDVPLSWMIGRLRQRMKSRKHANERLGYLEGSLQVLLDAMILKLEELGVTLLSNSRIENIEFLDNGIQCIKTSDHEIKGDHYLFTIPGINLSDLVKSDRPDLSRALSEINYFGAVCVILEMNKKLSDIYWLNIADPEFPFGGIIEQTNFIDPQFYNGSHIVYLSRYFTHSEPLATMNEDEIKSKMLSYLPKINPDFSMDWIKNVFVFRTNTAATVCDLSFSSKVPKCRTEVSNMFLANMAHIYPDERSANNSIRVAAEACKVMGIPTEHIPRNQSLSAQIGF